MRETPDLAAGGSHWLPRLVLPRTLDAKFGTSTVLLAVFGLGLAVRLVHLIGIKGSPFFSNLDLDAAYYDRWAQEIAGGAVIGKAAFWLDPLHAYLLGALYKLAGHDLLLPRLVNAAFGIGTAWLVWLIGLRVWRSRLAAVSAAVFSLLFVPAIHLEGQAEKTALSVFLLTASIHLLLVGSRRALLGAGLSLGLAVLARGNALALLPFGVLTLALGWDKKGSLLGSRSERWQRASMLLAGALPLIGLATLHNFFAAREFVPTTTNLGVNLYLGNHSANHDGFYTTPAFAHPSTERELPDFRAEAERRTGEKLSDAALSRYWAGEALREVLERPGLFVARTLKKVELALHNDELPDSDSTELVARWSPVLRSPLVWFGELLPLAVLGAAIGWRKRRVRILAATAGLYLASLLPFFVMERLRVQLLPMLSVLGGGAVVWLVAAARERNRRALPVLAALLPLVVLCFYRPGWMAERRETSLAVGFNNLGATLLRSGQVDDAIAAYERAIAVRADAVPAALRSLSQIHIDRGDRARAEPLLRRLLEIRPDSRSAREQLRQLTGEAPGTAREGMSRARALAREGRYEEAIGLLQNAVRTGPYDEGLHYYLGELMEQHSTPQAMVDFFSAEVGRDKKPQTSHYFWAVGLARAGDDDGAIAALKRALEIDPAHEMSQRMWGLILERKGDLQGAHEHLLEATKIHPDFRAAFEDAARVAERLGNTAEAESLRDGATKADPNSLRRFLHWARYLHDHGRDLAAWAEVQRLLAERPDDGEARALRDTLRAALERAGTPVPEAPAPAAASAEAWSLSSEARAAFKHKLASAPNGSPTWIVYDGRSAAAQSLAGEFAAALREAGWRIERVGAANIALKAGVHLFAADEPGPACSAIAGALTAAGFSPTFGTAYREFLASRRQENPSYVGLEFQPGQDHVLAVGRKP